MSSYACSDTWVTVRLHPSGSSVEGRVWSVAFLVRAWASTIAAAATLTSVARVFSWLFERVLAFKPSEWFCSASERWCSSACRSRASPCSSASCHSLKSRGLKNKRSIRQLYLHHRWLRPRDANQRSPHAGQRPPSGSRPCALTLVYLYCDTVARLPPRARVPPPRFGVDPLVNLPRGWVLQHVLTQRQALPPPCRACAGITVPTCPASTMYCRCSNTSTSRTTSSMGGIPR